MRVRGVLRKLAGAFALLAIVTSVGIALLLVAAKLLGIREFEELIARGRRMFSRGADTVLPAAPKNF